MTDLDDNDKSPIFLHYNGQPRDKVPDNVTIVVVDSSVSEIPNRAFYRCRNLSVVYCSEGLELIGKAAFEGCCSLRCVDNLFSLREIQDFAFADCHSLSSIELHEGLELMGQWAFYNCESLKVLQIPSPIKKIQEYTFNGCKGLARISLSEETQLIESHAFLRCESLITIRIPPSVIEIGSNAFNGCKSLVSAELSEGLKVLGENAFYKCCLLRNILFPSTVTEIGKNVFLHCRNIRQQFLDEESETYDEWEEGDSREVNIYLVNKMKDRFHELPIHKHCYFQAQHSMAITMKKIQEATPKDNFTDAFGMNPFHILALSNKPNYYLFSILMERFSLDVLFRRDNWGITPLHYLCWNNAPESLSLIRYALSRTIRNRSAHLGSEQWKQDILNQIEQLDRGDVSTRVRHLCSINKFLARYERLEAIALLQEAFWKAKITSIATPFTSSERHKCWLTSGAGIVFTNILPFLEPVEENTFDYMELRQYSLI